MSKFKHTKGPYRTISYGNVMTIESVDGQTVCDVHFPNNPHTQANIKMIMAMDEMLDALIRIANYGSKGFRGDFTQAQIARDAIEKATGLTWAEIQEE